MTSDPLDQLRILAWEHYDQEHWAATLVLARRILQTEPEDPTFLIMLGEALAHLYRWDEAQNAFQAALDRSHPKLREVIYGKLGHLYHARCDLDQAAVWFQRLIDAAPDDAGGYIFLAKIQALKGQFDDAEKLLLKGTRCQEGCIDEAFLNLGSIFRIQGKFVEANECYCRALEIDADYEIAQKNQDDVCAAMMHFASQSK